MNKILSLFAVALFGAMSISATKISSSVSNAENYNLNFKEHDLVYEANIGGSSDMNVEVINNELVLTSTANSQMYYSKLYTFDNAKTYFISGEVKADKESQFHLWSLPDWGLIVESFAVTTEYQSFYFTFRPNSTNQLGIQRVFPDTSSVVYNIKNFYFGECREISQGTAIGTLPAIPTREGHEGKWQIDGTDIDETTLYTWNSDKFADIKYDTGPLHLNFKEHDLVYEANIGGSSTMDVRVENNELVLTSTSFSSHGIYYSLQYNLDPNKTYTISGEYKTSDGSGFHLWNLGGDGSWDLIKTCEVSPEYASFSETFKPSVSSVQIGIQRAYPEGESTVVYNLKNFYFGECREVSQGTAIGTLPAIPTREGFEGKWQIDDNDITSSTIYTWDIDKDAKIKYEAEPLTLSFKEHDLIYEVNKGGTPSLTPSIINNELVLTANKSGISDAYFTYEYNFDPNKTYFVCGEYKTSVGAGLSINTNNPWGQIYVCGTSTEYTTFFQKFTNATASNQFCLQCAYGDIGSTFTFKSLYFGECRNVEVGSAIGELPSISSREGYDGKWQIDGKDITSSTIFTYTEDKFADILYIKKLSHINFKEHDLVKEANIGGSSTMDIEVNNDELILTSISKEKGIYYSKLYTFDTNKTYFISGEYKTNTGAIAQIWSLADWGQIYTCEPSLDYKSFYATFTPTSNTNQLAIQRVGPDTGTLIYTFKNLCFGECRALEKGATIGTLPTPTSSIEGYVAKGWEINGTPISSSSRFTYDNDVYADIIYEAASYKLAFTDKNYAKSTEGYKSNGKEIEYSSDTTTLTLNAKEDGAAVFLPSINANKAHNYMISFDLKTQDDANIIIGIDKKAGSEIITDYLSSPSSYSHYSFEFTAVFIDPSVEVVTTYIQFPMVGKAYIRNILIADLDDTSSKDVTYDSRVGTLPNIPTGYTGKWMLNGATLTEDSLYKTAHSSIAYLDAELIELYVGFKTNADDSSYVAFYKIKYGQKLSDVISELPKVPDVEGKTGKWLLNGVDVNLDTVVTSNITIVASYTDLPPTPTPGGGGNVGLIVGITVPCAVLIAGGVVAFVLIKKKRKVNK